MQLWYKEVPVKWSHMTGELLSLETSFKLIDCSVYTLNIYNFCSKIVMWNWISTHECSVFMLKKTNKKKPGCVLYQCSFWATFICGPLNQQADEQTIKICQLGCWLETHAYFHSNPDSSYSCFWSLTVYLLLHGKTQKMWFFPPRKNKKDGMHTHANITFRLLMSAMSQLYYMLIDCSMSLFFQAKVATTICPCSFRWRWQVQYAPLDAG